MKDLFDLLSRAIPFLAQYPTWVKLLVGVWVLLLAVIVLTFIFVSPRNKDPFTAVRVALSTVFLKIEQLQPKLDSPRVRSLVMIVSVSFVNDHQTFVRARDLRITFERARDTKRWQFMSEITIDIKEFLRSIGSTDKRVEREQQLENAAHGPFAPPMVPANGSIDMTIVFLPSEDLPLDPSELDEGMYRIVVESVEDETIRPVKSIPFTITSERRNVLDAGKAVVVPI